ncbi:MAG TPA: hypothetical protein VGL83_12615 [Stellaceae bacterium]|jgi:hypothetical protein
MNKASLIVAAAIVIHALIYAHVASNDRASQRCEAYLQALRPGGSYGNYYMEGQVALHEDSEERALFVERVIAATLKLSDNERDYCQFPVYNASITRVPTN